MEMNGKTVVLSDIHFGLHECSLGTIVEGKKLSRKEQSARETIIEKFVENLSDVQYMILLGDIFDLQISNLATSMRASIFFFQKLQSVETLQEIIYIPGNHDHILWFLHIFGRHVIAELQKSPLDITDGDFRVCSDLASNTNIFVNDQSFMRNIFGSQQRITVLYPFIKATVCEKKYFFTHGHFLDSQQTIYFDLIHQLYPLAAGLLRLDSSGISDPNIDELELYCSPLYNMFTMFGRTVRGRTKMKEIYQTFEDFKWTKSSDLDDKQLVKRIEKFLVSYGGQEGANKYYNVMDYLVFGHTHDANINIYLHPQNHKLKVVNTGCWLSSTNSIGSFLIIDPKDQEGEYPKLMLVDTEGNINEHASSIEMRHGGRPRKRGSFFYI